MSARFGCSCPSPEEAADYDGPEDLADACRDCPEHGTTVYLGGAR